MIELQKFIRSSADPSKISLTIKGVGVAVIPVLVMVMSAVGLDISESFLVSVVDALATAAASVMIFLGLARKLYFKFLPKQ